MIHKRDFKGVWIPKEIWLSKNLTLQEKVFLVEIDSLDNQEGCFATNQYFADFFGISKTRVSLVIKSLVDKGYITLELGRANKRKLKTSLIKVKDPLKQKLKTYNNTYNNIYNNKRKETIKEKKNLFLLVLEYFNRECKTNLRPTEKKRSQFSARLQTYTVDEIKKAITKRCKIKWYQDNGFYKDWTSLFRNDERIEQILNRPMEHQYKWYSKSTDNIIPITEQQMEEYRKKYGTSIQYDQSKDCYYVRN